MMTDGLTMYDAPNAEVNTMINLILKNGKGEFRTIIMKMRRQ